MKRTIYITLYITFLSLLLSYVLFGCDASKRLNRLVKNNPELKRTDTLTIHDTTTVIIDGVKVDTLISNTTTKDTIIITKEHLTIKTFVTDSTIYISGECDTILKTVFKTIEVPYEVISNNLPRDKLRWNDLLVICINIFTILIILKLVLKK